MCGTKKGELELEVLEAISSAPVPRRGKNARARSGVPGVAAGRNKVSAWTGVRTRHSGKWSTEIRVPRTREKVWIGTFANARQAALAYDAAVFCLFGERTPKARKINFPSAPRPEISETARLKLSINDMKLISEEHARKIDALLPPLPDEDTTPASADDLVRTPARPPVVVDPPAPCACVRRASRPDSTNEWDDEELDRMINAFDLEAFEAELEAVTFLAPDENVY